MRPATFVVRGDHVTLGQLLKLVGAIDAGGGARAFLAEGRVRVNGEPETRRGRKLRPGDLVSVPGMVSVRLVAEHGPPSG